MQGSCAVVAVAVELALARGQQAKEGRRCLGDANSRVGAKEVRFT